MRTINSNYMLAGRSRVDNDEGLNKNVRVSKYDVSVGYMLDLTI